MRAHDWSSTSLGPPKAWPQPLRTVIRLLLTTNHPMFVFWGPDLICFYNDAYSASLGSEKHPSILGARARIAWDEIWEIIGPQIDFVLSGNGATWHENQRVPITRHGRRDDVYWTYGFSPIDDDSAASGVGGVLAVCTETTSQVLGEERAAFRLRLMESLRDVEAPGAVMAVAAEFLRQQLDAGRVGYAEVDETGTCVMVEQDWTAEASSGIVGPHRLDDFGPAVIAELRAGRTVRIDDVAHDPLIDPSSLKAYGGIGTRAMLDAPLVKAGRLAAVLYVLNQSPRSWTDGEAALVEEVAERTWGAIERARAVAALRASDERQRFLLGMEEQLRGLSDPSEILSAAAQALGQKLRAGRVAYADVDDTVQYARIARDWNDGSLPSDPGRRRLEDFGEGVTADLRAGRTISIGDVHADPRTSSAEALAAFDKMAVSAFLNVPLIKQGKLVAVMVVHSRSPRPWQPHEIALVEEVAARTWATVERARAVFLLRDSEERMRLALEAGNLGDWELDLASRIATRSPRYYKIFGYDTPPPAWNTEIFMQHVVDEDRERVSQSLRATFDGHKPLEFECRINRADGAVRWIAARGELVRGDAGKLAGLIGVVTDLTERKLSEIALAESEARLQAITDSVEQMIWSTRPDGFHDFYNQRWYEYTGMPEGSTDGEAWNGMFHPDDQERAWARWRHSLATGEAYHIEYRLRHRSGQYRWVLGRAQAMRDEAGRITRWYGTCTDIQELVEAREVLSRSREELEQMVGDRTAALMALEDQLRQSQKMEAVGQLTGGLAHDFNNLLIAITGSLEMLQRRVAQGRLGEVDRYVNAAQGAARRAASLTQRLLAFSRRQTLDPKPTDINRLVAAMEDLIRRTVGPEITVEVVGAVGLWIASVDPNQLENALLNLCINARDAMPDGGRLTIETANRWLDDRAARERDLPPGQYLSLCVTDTGTGMAPEVIEHAFDPFFTTKPIGMGTGLGLSMVYGFARQSGGQVRVYSELGQGTTMCLYLPRSYGSEAVEEAAEASDGARAAPGQTVLVVDDEPAVRMLMIEVLEELGYATLEARDGASGLGLLRSDARIDLLITDVGLPGGINGRQVADGGRAVRPALKTLFITGYAENAVLGNGHLEPGMQVMTKPFAMDALARRVTELIGRE